MVERLTNIEERLNLLKTVDEKLDILTDEILGMRNEVRELKASNELLANQINLFGNNSESSESFIKVSIF